MKQAIFCNHQEQVDLKLRAGELKQHEAAVAREREALERQREELDREKERLSSTGLQLKTRAQEVEAFSKVWTTTSSLLASYWVDSNVYKSLVVVYDRVEVAQCCDWAPCFGICSWHQKNIMRGRTPCRSPDRWSLSTRPG